MSSERERCPWCEVRFYDASRFDHCYWCHRILTEGLFEALPDYLEQGDHRTGTSMFDAHDRMVAAGLIEDEVAAVQQPHPLGVVRPPPPTLWERVVRFFGKRA